MNKRAWLLPMALALLIFFSAGAVSADVTRIDVSGRALNAQPLYGPEGIALAPDGNLYCGEQNGKIRRLNPDGTAEVFADLNDLPGERDAKISAIGIAVDEGGDIYVATLDFNGGSVLKVVGPEKPEAGKVSLYRRGIGMANFVLIDDENGIMYVSNSSMFSGSVFRFDMRDETLIGTPADPEKELLGRFRYANGLALGPEKKWLYVAETTKGQITKVNLATKQKERFAKPGGWMDGLAFDPQRRLFFACDNKGGKIVAIGLSGQSKGEACLTGREGQCAPASLVFSGPDTIVFTDLWKASMWDALFGKPRYHSYVYEISVNEILE